MALTGAVITDERLKVFDFTPPWASAQHYFVKRAGDTSLNTIADLSGKKVGVQAGSALLARLPELKAMLEKTGGKLGRWWSIPPIRKPTPTWRISAWIT
jgi:polar amino acid transport system substrate-binding protein